MALPALLSGGGEAASEAAERGRLDRPPTRWDPISYGRERKRQMASYSRRHYGQRKWRLRKPRALVLHYTAGSTYSSAWSTFQANEPALGERPGVCAHFVVDKDGTIYQLVRMSVRCRHAIGLNHLSLGIEMVQEEVGGPRATAKVILRRKRQARAAVRLAAWLKQRYRIKMRNLIGHAMANASPLFEDRAGWRNDHADWQRPEVRSFRHRVARLLHHRRAAGAGGRRADRRVSFGRSLRGRPLTALRLGEPSSDRRVLVIGEIHGDEQAGREVVERLRRRHAGIDGVDPWTVLSVNPDGHAADTRGNARGVDLNRNFSREWSGAEPPASGYYGGPRPFSEPESRALRRLLLRVRPDLTIHYHQPWGAVLAPCEGRAGPERAYARRTRLPLERCRGEGLSGTATKWSEHRLGEPAFVVELPGGSPSRAGIRRHARAVVRLARG